MLSGKLSGAIALAVSIAFGAGYTVSVMVNGRLVDAPVPPYTTRRYGKLDPPPIRKEVITRELYEDVPQTPAETQQLARKKILAQIGQIRNFQPGCISCMHSDTFFTSPRGARSGLCVTTAISFDGRHGAIRLQNRYLVVGSLVTKPRAIETPHPQRPVRQGRTSELDQNCNARYASADWFTVDGEEISNDVNAWEGAMLLDGVVAAARSRENLPFTLTCDPNYGNKWICADPRASLASVDPSRTANVGQNFYKVGSLSHFDTTVTVARGDNAFTVVTIHRVHRSGPISWKPKNVELAAYAVVVN